MINNKWRNVMAGTVIASMLLSACSNEAETTTTTQTAVNTEKQTSEINAQTASYAQNFNKDEVMSFSIDVDEDAWQEMLDTATEENYIKANVTINGTTIENVGIRAKGNSSLRQVAGDDTTDRYSFKIKFDEYVKGQTWNGLDKMVVNNMISDASYMKEYLSYDIMSYIGVDAPLFAFANINVNGKTWGLYLAVEDIDSGYLDRAKNGEGEIYKPNNDGNMGAGGMGNPMGMGNPPAEGDAAGAGDRQPPEGMEPPSDTNAGTGTGTGTANSQTANTRGEGGRGFGRGGGMNGGTNGVSLVYTDDKVSSYSGIFDNAKTKTTEEDEKRVIEALKNLNAGTDLEKYVDIDAVLKYFAAHNVVVNMDSYTSNMGHNYYLYENNGKISMLPWDYNMAFGGFQAGSASDVVNLAIDTPLSGVTMEERPILSKLLEVPEYKAKYHEYLQEIVDGYFADGKFEQTVQTLDKLITDYVKNDPTAFVTYDKYKAAVAELTKLGTLRAESIQGQLDGTIPATTEEQKSSPNTLIDSSSIDLTKLGDDLNKGKGMNGGGPWQGLERNSSNQETKKAEQSDTTK
ncbi:CotH kinase family protein [Paenibacillus silvae]|uniref:CotH kinase family protein n=1 Tax=Paenibacillus silvae TaxID=1325358 RepID=UPI0020031CD0|nr:CotH kinase family protein [Paenibacillus silvae]MCK6075570.1 CotH kinase family protein [Paenibacillus silvae]MCK6149957.1 CotH kinase family protein [Paenibacillus silvae]MCK6268255.1 CotH kinase family protein [Paenibacillus silvae]